GNNLKEMGFIHGLLPESDEVSVKAPVFSFTKLKDVDSALGPEMKSTGEAMGRDFTLEKALDKAFQATGIKLPKYGSILVTLADKHKEDTIPLLKRFYMAGFNFYATEGTSKTLKEHGLPVKTVAKIGREEKDLLCEIQEGNIDIVINTITKGKNIESDGHKIREAAVANGVICLTTLDTAEALVRSIELNSLGIISL